MVEYLMPIMAFFLAGIAGGVLLGLIGVGMALITVPLLIFVLPRFGLDPNTVPLVALATSMGVVSVGSISSIWSHSRKGNVDWHVAQTTIPASLIGILAGTLAASHLPATMLRLLFCVFLIYIAVRMLWVSKEPVKSIAKVSKLTYRIAGAAIGLAASVIGAGGGVLMVPFLLRCGHKMPTAVSTSTAIGLPVSVIGAIIYSAQSNVFSPILFGYLFVPAFIGLSFGSIVGAPIGASLAGILPASKLKKGFAIILLAVAAGILFKN